MLRERFRSVGLFSSSVRSLFSVLFSIFLTIFSIVEILELKSNFILRFSICQRIIGFLCVAFLLYLVSFLIQISRSSRIIRIRDIEVRVSFGDIFSDEYKDCGKVIAFNEFFDTIVDDVIIRSGSINGKFIKNNMRISVDEFDEGIRNDTMLNSSIINEQVCRKKGKTVKYKLGSIYRDKADNAFCLALTHFTLDTNNAYFESRKEFINCLMDFWDNLAKLYNGQRIAIPLLCSGIVRFNGQNRMTPKESLELILTTLSISTASFCNGLEIVIYSDNRGGVDINKIAMMYRN